MAVHTLFSSKIPIDYLVFVILNVKFIVRKWLKYFLVKKDLNHNAML